MRKLFASTAANTAAAAIIAATVSSANAAGPHCIEGEIDLGKYFNCNIPKADGGTFTAQECKDTNKKNLDAAKQQGLSAQVRVNGDRMFICAKPPQPVQQ